MHKLRIWMLFAIILVFNSLLAKEVGYYNLPDGARMRYAYYAHDNIEADTVVILPGKGSFIEKYEDFILDLRNMGHNVWMFEPRGIGGSSRMLEDSDKYHIDDFSTYSNDFNKFFHDVILSQNRSGGSILFVGVSMGGLIASHYLMHHGTEGVDGLIMLTPALDINTRSYPKFTVGFVGKVSQMLDMEGDYVFGYGEGGCNPELLNFKDSHINSQTRFEKVKNLEMKHRDFITCGPTYGFGYAVLRAVDDVVQNSYKLDIPTAIIEAGRDEVVGNDNNNLVCHKMGCVYVKRYVNASHETYARGRIRT